MSKPLKICIQRATTRQEWDAMQDDYINRAVAAAGRIEKLESALVDILKVPRSEASWGIALVIAHHALKEGKMTDYEAAFRNLTDKWHESVKHYEDRIEKLETALRLYACESTCPNCYGQVQDTRYCGWTARKALEGKDE